MENSTPIKREAPQLKKIIAATSTPLASIFGSGFLIIVPILKVFVDIEGDRTAQHPYLIGCNVSGSVEDKPVSFWANDTAEAADIVGHLLGVVRSLNNFFPSA